MNLTTKQIKQIIQEELKILMVENEVMSWANKTGVREEVMYDMLMVPNGIEMMAMLMKYGFQLENSDDTKMTWKVQTQDDGFWGGETIQLQFTVPKDNEKPSILYRAVGDKGFLETNPFETTFNDYEEVINFVDTRFAGQQESPEGET